MGSGDTLKLLARNVTAGLSSKHTPFEDSWAVRSRTRGISMDVAHHNHCCVILFGSQKYTIDTLRSN